MFLIMTIVYHASAPVAQLVEHFHGKEKVAGSIPAGGFGKE